MTDLLKNELILKYFSPEYKAYYPLMDATHKQDAAWWDRCQLAYNVLQAMQEPIYPGDRIILLRYDGVIKEDVWSFDSLNWRIENDQWHGHHLRLPDKFQTKPCCCKCTCHERTK